MSRKDDIISICYIILKLAKVSFPWGYIKFNKVDISYKQQVLKCKKNIGLTFIGNDYAIIKDILLEVEKLKYDEKPNYDKFIKKCHEELEKINSQDINYKFIWTKILKKN